MQPLTYNGTTWLLTRLTRAKNLVANEECIDHIHHLHGGSKAWVNVLCDMDSYKNVVRWDGIGNTWSSTNSAQVAPRPYTLLQLSLWYKAFGSGVACVAMASLLFEMLEFFSVNLEACMDTGQAYRCLREAANSFSCG